VDTAVVVVLVVVGIVIVAFLGTAIFLFVKLIRMGRLIRSDLMPLQGKIVFWAAVLYGVSPLDLLPDPIYLDDVGILVAAMAYITHLAKKHNVLDGIGPRRLPKQTEIDSVAADVTER
jgi:uncharacterized membrane protein YkvA (DUF1232 family)